MRKKVLLSMLAGVLSVGVLAACGDVEDDGFEEDPGFEDEGDMDEDI
ncbi:hypothetical protein [Alteribacter populi]|nr:hypothetical protein [Alteribacter populi]